MRTVPILGAFCIMALTGLAHAQEPRAAPVQRLDPALDALIAPDAKLELVKTGFGFTEGAVWVPRGEAGYLLFSDIPANVIYMWNPLDDKVSVYLDHSGYTGPDIWRVGFMQTNGKDKSDPKFEEFPMIGSNGLTLDREGRLIIATCAGRSIDRIEWDGKRTVLADRSDGKRFGGTNDVVVKNDDAIYFTDGFGGLRRTMDFHSVLKVRERPFHRDAVQSIQNPIISSLVSVT
jgi:gluconolactonase